MRFVLPGLGVERRRLEKIQRSARVAAGRLSDEGERLVVEAEVARAEAAGDVPQRATGDPRDRLGSERLEHDDLASREKRAVQLERRIFRRRADQDDLSRFDVRQEHVLLRAVEPVDLVEEEDRPLGRRGAPLPAPSRTSRISFTPVATAE